MLTLYGAHMHAHIRGALSNANPREPFAYPKQWVRWLMGTTEEATYEDWDRKAERTAVRGINRLANMMDLQFRQRSGEVEEKEGCEKMSVDTSHSGKGKGVTGSLSLSL